MRASTPGVSWASRAARASYGRPINETSETNERSRRPLAFTADDVFDRDTGGGAVLVIQCT